MADLGVKLIKGDLDDPQSYAKGLEGAYASFVNANCECISLQGTAADCICQADNSLDRIQGQQLG